MINIERIKTYSNNKLSTVIRDISLSKLCDYCAYKDKENCSDAYGKCVEGLAEWLNQEEADRLLPCPFCGGKADIFTDDDADCFWIHCTECEIQTQKYPKMISEEIVIRIWNIRLDNSKKITEGEKI